MSDAINNALVAMREAAAAFREYADDTGDLDEDVSLAHTVRARRNDGMAHKLEEAMALLKPFASGAERKT